MATWTHIASEASDGDQLDLYERGGLYMIRAGGWELMNGEYHASEDELGRLAALLPRTPHPEILIGGLGLGYTLASLLAAARGRTPLICPSITVAERSGAVLHWFADHTNPDLAASLPPCVRLTESDVAAHLGTHGRWDVIVLDVDNGPEAVSTPTNAALYGEGGLSRCRDSLAPAGHLLLWSSFGDGAFVERARRAGFSVSAFPVPYPDRPDASHILYVLSRQKLSSADRDRLGLGP